MFRWGILLDFYNGGAGLKKQNDVHTTSSRNVDIFDFLLVIFSNHMGLSAAVSEIKGDFGWKLHFSALRVFIVPGGGSPLEIWNASRT